MRVVCTAGHVDHGKSTLVRALTGMEPDRFEEERRRGLTIDLGFAWAELAPSGDAVGPPAAGPAKAASPAAGPAEAEAPVTVAFVDLPGHERFVANMLAGAGPVECALFVVAADEGFMPQSREHLDILDLLGVRHGLVALTKADLVDAEHLEGIEREVRGQLQGTTFARVPMVAVSAATGAGIDELRATLAGVLTAMPPTPDLGRPRLWVDRSFSIKGAGTVVTGTLSGGALAVGDELRLLPSQTPVRVRGLQSLKSAVERAAPGSRVAVNVSGIERTGVARGDALVQPGQWLAVTAFEAEVRVLGEHEIDRKGAWHVHAGSAERPARVYPLTGPVRGSGFVRVELERPLSLTAGDRFVLREAGRRMTMGGGLVLDADPPARARGAGRARRAEELTARANALGRSLAGAGPVEGAGALSEQAVAPLKDEPGGRAGLVALTVRERGIHAADRVAAAAGLPSERAAQAARAAGLLPLGDAWAAPSAVAGWAEGVRTALAAHHAAQPLDRVAPRDVATRAAAVAGCPVERAVALVDMLARMGRVVAEGPGVRLPEHRVRLDPVQERARAALLAALGAEPFSPPRLSDAAGGAGATPALVKELEATSELVRLGPELAFTASAVEAAADLLRERFGGGTPFTAGQGKEALGTSRKYAVPLLEELDRRGVTRRDGDVRSIRPA